ncbi:TetR/AcrR family transcriptional regulator [Thioclava sp.]|uniref:TetR/AcrR family transcriptional regulator n=1 Tax=Thioclava sp. TaxID=1933450 RepID=UPI003AA9376A
MSSETSDYGRSQTREHILKVSWNLAANHGSNLKLTEVAAKAGVSRQAIYLHFGDRAGLLLALVRHMDETLDLRRRLAHVQAAPDGGELLERAMRLNTHFWSAVFPVARILEAAQNDDPALGSAWRDRMAYRQKSFAAMIRQIADMGELSPDWDIEEAAALLFATTHFDTWRELTQHFGWTEDRYVSAMTRLLCRTFLERTQEGSSKKP